jgi:hypothetical protein
MMPIGRDARSLWEWSKTISPTRRSTSIGTPSPARAGSGFGGVVERRRRAFNDLLLARSDIAPGENVLEIGCGTGATTVPLAEAVGERGRVVGAIYPSRCWLAPVIV